MDRMQGEEMIFHSPEFNLVRVTRDAHKQTVYLYPKENVTVLQDNFVEIPSVFDYYEGSEYNTLLYGTDEVYNVSRIYGTYYHVEPYVSHSYPDVPSLLMRVRRSHFPVTIGALRVLRDVVPRAPSPDPPWRFRGRELPFRLQRYPDPSLHHDGGGSLRLFHLHV